MLAFEWGKGELFPIGVVALEKDVELDTEENSELDEEMLFPLEWEYVDEGSGTAIPGPRGG